MTGAELLKMNEEDFSKSIQEMAIKDLMETISDLQKEMAKEQENFNLLSSELKNFKDRNSRQYKQISKDMVASQHRLTLLMNRSIKCFAQQNLHNNSDSPLKRRNSAKGLPHASTPASALSNLHRSKSLLAVNQTDGSHLISSFQSPTKPHVTEPGSSVYNSMNATHVPVIMTTTKNGTVKKSLEGGVSSNVDRSRQGSVSSSKEQIQQPAPSITGNREISESGGSGNCRDSADSVSDSNNVSVSSGVGGGMYVKRKPVQQTRVTTTANISSSKFMPKTVPVSEPASSTPSSLASAASPVTRALSSRSAGPASNPSFTNESQFVKSKPLASQSDYASPLQMAQARKGVSKSQTIIQDTDSSYQGLRGLPSVKLLAQSFGSNTALNTIPGSSPNYSGSQTSKFIISSSSGVYRSNSTLNLSNPQNAAAPTRIFISKGSTGEASEQAAQQEPALYINGKSQQLSKQYSRPPQASSSNSKCEPTEWEKTRSKLRTVKRETVAETTVGSMNSGVVAPSSQTTVLSLKDQERVEESPPADKYVKRKDNAAVKTSTSVQSTPSVTIKSINSSSSLVSSKITNSVPISTSQNKSSSQPSSVSSTSPNVNTNSFSSVSKYHSTSSSSPHTKLQTTTIQQKQQSGTTNSSKMSYATMPHREAGSGNKVVSAASMNLRRAKSREELQQIENDTRSNKDMLLKQIQARRKDAETHSDRPNIRSMSSLSQSMPSLLLDDSDGFHKGGDGSKTSPVKSSIALLPAEKASADFTTFVDDGIEMDDEDRVPRMNLRDWDPNPVYSVLYEVKLMDEVIEDISHQFITMEGLMEKLPMNKRKATLLKTWKRRFFRAKDGWLYYYESSNTDQPSESIQLMGGTIHDMGGRTLGIDDGRGRYLMVRCPTEKEYGQWKVSLESQTADNTKATYVRPVLKSPRHTSKNVVIVDLGSCAIRAGVLGQQACLPELFFPSLVAVDKESSKVVAVGRDAMRPDIRHRYKVLHPIRPSNKVDQFNIEVHLMGAIFDKVFHELNVNPADYWVMISTPQNLGDPLKKGLMEILVDVLKVRGVCMVPQALLSLYSYNATSGIIVDIGHRMEILPIFDGFVIEGGVARCPYGAQKVQESLTTYLLSNNYKFFSTTEQLLVRYIMERVCYVAIDYPQEVEWVNSQPQTARAFVNFRKFGLPDGSYTGVECDLGRFKSPEGLFNVNMWEMDYQTLQKLVYQAIQTCPMDNRRHVWRAIFLSGGVTLLPGFAERLEKELSKLAPPGVPVEVHAAPQRYHAAFVGACSVALMPQFEGMAISKEEWKKEGVKAFRKWQAPSS